MLYLSAFERSADFVKQGRADFPLNTLEFDLDEFMGLEAGIDLVKDGGSQPVLANTGNGIQMVSGGTKCLALFGGQFNHARIFACK